MPVTVLSVLFVCAAGKALVAENVSANKSDGVHGRALPRMRDGNGIERRDISMVKAIRLGEVFCQPAGVLLSVTYS
jgi:hypothetical protein